MNKHVNKHKALRKSFKASSMHGHHYEKGKLVANTMNPVRAMVMKLMIAANTDSNLAEVARLNAKFVSLSRGHGRG